MMATNTTLRRNIPPATRLRMSLRWPRTDSERQSFIRSRTLARSRLHWLHPVARFSAPRRPILTISSVARRCPRRTSPVSAALLLAQNPNLTVAQLKSLLLFNGDVSCVALNGKTFTGRRLNVGNSFAALASNDTTAPGAVTNFHVNSQTGRSFDLGWTASGDDGASGQASLYQLSFTDAVTGAVVAVAKHRAGSVRSAANVHRARFPTGTPTERSRLREFDNVGNEGTPVTVNVSISFVDGNPYASAAGQNCRAFDLAARRWRT